MSVDYYADLEIIKTSVFNSELSMCAGQWC